MKRGDILTHPFTIPTPTSGQPLWRPSPGKVLPQILELKDRGILTEGQTVNSHHLWVISEKAFAQGWIPDLMGTDMGAVDADMPNGILLPWTMTQYLHLGLTVEQVIERVTLTPTKVFKFPDKMGTLEPGVAADVTVIDLQQGQLRAPRPEGQQAHGQAEVRARRRRAWRDARRRSTRRCTRPKYAGVRIRSPGVGAWIVTPMHMYLIVVHRVGCGPGDRARAGAHDRSRRRLHARAGRARRGRRIEPPASSATKARMRMGRS